MSDIMEVPLPLAAVRFLMSFLTLKISICWSVSSSAVGMVANDIDVDGSSRWNEGGRERVVFAAVDGNAQCL